MDGFNQTSAAVVALAAIALGIVKPVVDVIKMALPALPAWVYPLLAFVVGIVIIALLLIVSGSPITVQAIALIILASLITATGSVGINRLQSRADDARAQAIAPQVQLKLEATGDSAPAQVTVLNTAEAASEFGG